ncbi:MAG TPA: isocitrate/isopropylmalate family dehydrogenase [Acidimicrobiia bacterium]|nr:isocitrate/isopropylmalate family dehydrogenase [Acidimicrobiia bacterium]
MRRHRIALLPGDGIGTEVCRAARVTLEAIPDPDLSFEFTELPMGLVALESEGDPLPQSTIDQARAADAVLHGATDASSIAPGIRPPLSGLRRELGCFASVRPSVSIPGVDAVHTDVDLVVIRELTEGTYSKIEFEIQDAVCTVRVTSRAATQRVARLALEYARTRRRHVTVVHKRAGVPRGDSFWLEVIADVAVEFGDVTVRTANVDAVAHDLVRAPQEFDVILAENLNGDILSDVAAAVTGGLPLAASACIGAQWAYFEPVHGSAPTIAGLGKANPAGTMLASAMLLEHIGETGAADRLRRAVKLALADPSARTADLGGSASTDEFTAAVVGALCEPL